MKLDSSYTMINQLSGTSTINSINQNDALKEKTSGKEMSDHYLFQYQTQIEDKTKDGFFTQADVYSSLLDLYSGKKSFSELTQAEAKELVSEDGFFGVKNTSQRIADFVLNGAGDNVDLLKAGREGILTGFSQAEDIWGTTLPDISYQTIHKAVAKIDEKLASLGVNVLDSNA